MLAAFFLALVPITTGAFLGAPVNIATTFPSAGTAVAFVAAGDGVRGGDATTTAGAGDAITTAGDEPGLDIAFTTLTLLKLRGTADVRELNAIGTAGMLPKPIRGTFIIVGSGAGT